MTYNFWLFWRMAYRSFFKSQNTPARLTRKRLIFILLFYFVWPIGSLFIWLGILLDEVFFPAYKKHPMEKPLFILGNFRSGSTFLHRLLSRDTENFTSLTTWDIYLSPSITSKKIVQAIGRVDHIFGSPLKRAAMAFDRRSLGQVRIHRISFFQPEEDENILMHIWSTYFVSFLFPFMDEMPPYQFFDEALKPEQKRRIMAFYKSMLQRHLYATGKRHFVAKNPAFSSKIETLVEFFPNARIIYLVRNPLDMLPSTASWINYARSVFTEPKEQYLYLDEIVKMTQFWYQHPLSYLDAHSSQNHLIIKYDDLISDPERVIRHFYKRFGYAEQPWLDQIVAQSVDETLAYQSDHIYSYEEMGFTHQQIISLYPDIFERFRFDKREWTEPRVDQPAQIPVSD
ncbi:MAG: sulfotransferase [Chloroflexi bacterium]|nr:sulfotransferase [Chloroflexota bacterium]